MSMFGSQPSPPSPPPFHPINVGDLASSALSQDISRYSSYNFPVFPGMTGIRNSEIQDAYNQLTSPLSSDYQNAFLRNATAQEQSSVGGYDPYSGMGLGKGSFGKGATSASFTNQALAKQDYDRARFEALMGQNPVPQLGLSQNDLLSLYLYNTGAQNAWSMGNYANQIAAANAQYANQVQTYGAIGNTIAGLGNLYYQYQNYNNMYGGGGGYGSGMTSSGDYIG